MNIFECRGKKLGKLYCAHIDIELDEKGKICTGKCNINQEDHYVLLPEHDKHSGNVIYNRMGGSDPIPHGINLVWENITQHEHGLSFNSDRKLRMYEEIHPDYHLEDYIRPNISAYGVFPEDKLGIIFGDNNPALVSPFWEEIFPRGIQRVQPCKHAVYGNYDRYNNMIMPRAMKNYIGQVKGFVDYTYYGTGNNQKFCICDESNKDVINYLSNWFDNKLIIKRIIDALKYIKQGKYIDLRNLLCSNGINESVAERFVKSISIKSINTIYGKTSTYNLFILLKSLNKKVKNGKMDFIVANVLSANIINYMMNDPRIQLEVNNIFHPQHKRWWWTILALKHGIREKIVQKELVPKWAIEQMKYIKNGSNSYRRFGTTIDTNNINEENSSDVMEAIIRGKDNTDFLYPAMVRISDIISNVKIANKISDSNFKIFTNILKAGIKFTPEEIRITWFNFAKAIQNKKPSMFWTFINGLLECNENELDNYIIAGGTISENKAFAQNLINSKINNNTFDIKVPKYQERYFQTSGRSMLDSGADRRNVFWKQLSLIGLKHDKSNLKRHEEFTFIDEQILGVGDFYDQTLDEEDYKMLTIIDPKVIDYQEE